MKKYIIKKTKKGFVVSNGVTFAIMKNKEMAIKFIQLLKKQSL